MLTYSSPGSKVGKAGVARKKSDGLEFLSLKDNAPRNLTEECVLRILSLMKDGKLKAGDRISEISIAEQIQMGRAPTRGALDRLAQANVLERLHRAGTFVRELSLEEFSEIMDVRAHLECLSARLAAQRIDGAAKQALMAMALEVDRLNYDDPDVPQQQRYHADQAFHNMVTSVSGNSRLIGMLQSQHLLEFSFISGYRIMPKHRELQAEMPTHEAIAQAIIEHKIDEAGELMRVHVVKSKQIRLSYALGESR